MRKAGLPVRVNVFASDKLSQGEANWHYTPAEVTSILKPFSDEITAAGASFTVFDERG
jgi:hypothetical protein